MFQAPSPDPDALPSPGTLLRSTALAVAVAAVLLMTVVLPAEYGIDPTGVGQVLGLKRMGEIKVALALEAEADAAADGAALAAEALAPEDSVVAPEVAPPGPAANEAGENSGMAEVVLQPDEGKEVKLAMSEGASVRYEWSAVGGGVNFDLHADQSSGPSHSYKKGFGLGEDEGEFTAAFDGMHGWFFRNRTDAVVTVTLKAEGDFEEMREMR